MLIVQNWLAPFARVKMQKKSISEPFAENLYFLYFVELLTIVDSEHQSA